MIESFLLSGVRGNSILSELNHFFYSFFAFGLTSIVTLHFGILFSPNGVEKMIGLWYNAVNLLEGELFDDSFKRADPDHAQESLDVTGGFRKNAECIRWNDKPLGKRQNQAEYHGNEKNQGFCEENNIPFDEIEAAWIAQKE